MKVSYAWWLGCCSLLASCDEALLRTADGKFRVVAQIETTGGATAATEAALRAAGPDALLVALPSTGADSWRAARATLGATHRLLLVDPDDVSGPPTAGDAIVVADDGAAAAVELALLSCHGIDLPPRVPLGSRTITHANAAAGGAPRLGPGQLILQLLRNQHTALLTEQPTGDVVFRIGFVGQRPDAHHRRLRERIAAAKKRFPQLVLQDEFADGELARIEGLARELVAGGCRALLLSVDDPTQLAATRTIADAGNVALVVLDPLLRGEFATCVLGCEQTLLGRAAGEVVPQLLPDGGSLVLLHGGLHDSLQRQRRDGFVAALHLEAR